MTFTGLKRIGVVSLIIGLVSQQQDHALFATASSTNLRKPIHITSPSQSFVLNMPLGSGSSNIATARADDDYTLHNCHPDDNGEALNACQDYALHWDGSLTKKQNCEVMQSELADFGQCVEQACNIECESDPDLKRILTLTANDFDKYVDSCGKAKKKEVCAFVPTEDNDNLPIDSGDDDDDDSSGDGNYLHNCKPDDNGEALEDCKGELTYNSGWSDEKNCDTMQGQLAEYRTCIEDACNIVCSSDPDLPEILATFANGFDSYVDTCGQVTSSQTCSFDESSGEDETETEEPATDDGDDDDDQGDNYLHNCKPVDNGEALNQCAEVKITYNGAWSAEKNCDTMKNQLVEYRDCIEDACNIACASDADLQNIVAQLANKFGPYVQYCGGEISGPNTCKLSATSTDEPDDEEPATNNPSPNPDPDESQAADDDDDPDVLETCQPDDNGEALSKCKADINFDGSLSDEENCNNMRGSVAVYKSCIEDACNIQCSSNTELQTHLSNFANSFQPFVDHCGGEISGDVVCSFKVQAVDTNTNSTGAEDDDDDDAGAPGSAPHSTASAITLAVSLIVAFVHVN